MQEFMPYILSHKTVLTYILPSVNILGYSVMGLSVATAGDEIFFYNFTQETSNFNKHYVSKHQILVRSFCFMPSASNYVTVTRSKVKGSLYFGCCEQWHDFMDTDVYTFLW